MPFPIAALIPVVGNLLDKLIPDKDAAEKAKNELSTLLTTQEFQIQLAQIQVNMEEAKSTNWFVAGWRPYIGWACGLAFTYTYILLPFLLFFVYTFGTATMVSQVSKLPALDLAMMLPVLFGMLGLGKFRTDEKIKNAEKNR